jgi:hypothetical protein
MKLFNNIQNLWEYCQFCTVCQDNTREVSISIAPDKVFELISYEKKDQFLILHCTYFVNNQKSIFNYMVDCLDNSFQFQILHTEIISEVNLTSDRYTSCFWFQSECKKCNQTYVNGNDLEFHFNTSLISNIGVEREGIFISSEEHHYHIVYSEDVMTIYKTRAWAPDEEDDMDQGPGIDLPVVAFDFSNQQKVINRIQTLLVFN